MTWPRIIGMAHQSMVSVLGESTVVSLEDERVEVRGIFINPPLTADVGGADYRGQSPVLHIRIDDAPTWLRRGATVEARGKSYVVTDVIRDGEGMFELVLKCQ